MQDPYKIIEYGGLKISYADDLHGGGKTFGQDYLNQFAQRFGRQDRIFEWCSGPGFIGFSLLANGFCNSLCLADINPRAVSACEHTIRENSLADVVRVYQSDCLDVIPPGETWDMVVGNPPHSGTAEMFPEWGPSIIYMDKGFGLHRKFYGSVSRFLRPKANVLIQENRRFSSVNDFSGMIADGGLTLLGVVDCAIDPDFYYVWSTRI